MRTAARVCGGPFCTVDFSLRTRYHIYISPAREHEVRSSARLMRAGPVIYHKLFKISLLEIEIWGGFLVIQHISLKIKLIDESGSQI